ncbi:MAG: hypothetical protein OXI45_02915 [Acidobacteriota bacterium]|nr:hypothetical protein [Acidobacteriota bacterium]
MTLEIGTIETVPIRKVWPKEDADFTPWLRSHLGELDKTLGLGLKNPRSEVGAGDFRIDLVAETDFGDVVIENQYGWSDHRHLGQLVTYLADRDVHLAIWIVEHGRPEHVKAVEVLNDRGVGRVWMVAVRAIQIGASAAAPLFTTVVAPSESELAKESTGKDLSPGEIKKRDFMTALVKHAGEEGIASPFQGRAPSVHGWLHTPARGQGLFYRVAVNKKESRVVVTNVKGRWEGAFVELASRRSELDSAFATAGLPGTLEWPEQVSAGRWAIRYTVEVGYEDEFSAESLRELNRAAVEMKRVFDPVISALDPTLEEDVGESSSEVDE